MNRTDKLATSFIVIIVLGFFFVATNAVIARQTSREHQMISEDLRDHSLYELEKTQVEQDKQIAVNTQHLSEVDRRLNTIEGMQVEKRLATIENTMNENQGYLRSLVGGILVLIAASGVQFFITRRLHGKIKERSD